MTRIALVCLFISAAVVRSAPEPAVYGLAAGPYAVQSAICTLARAQPKAADLSVRVTWPRLDKVAKREKGPRFPVIVFSHGMYGNKQAYDPLIRHWASHGYVCIQTDHPDSLVHGVQPREEAQRAWRERPRQVSFLIESLGKLEACVPGLKGRVDRERIGVGGHSFGAHTSLLIGGATIRGAWGGRGLSFRDERVRCVLLLSPQGIGGGLSEESFATLKVPFLLVTGSKDASPFDPEQVGEWRTAAFRFAPADPRYLVYIDGAHHGFGGITGGKAWRGSGPSNEDHVRIVRATSLAFWDARLKQLPAARKYLDSEAPAKAGQQTKVRYERSKR